MKIGTDPTDLPTLEVDCTVYIRQRGSASEQNLTQDSLLFLYNIIKQLDPSVNSGETRTWETPHMK